MEEWHQKLHNNTTPDDIPICEAYLAFLESSGNVGAYWRVLSDAGEHLAALAAASMPSSCCFLAICWIRPWLTGLA